MSATEDRRPETLPDLQVSRHVIDLGSLRGQLRRRIIERREPRRGRDESGMRRSLSRRIVVELVMVRTPIRQT